MPCLARELSLPKWLHLFSSEGAIEIEYNELFHEVRLLGISHSSPRMAFNSFRRLAVVVGYAMGISW